MSDAFPPSSASAKPPSGKGPPRRPGHVADLAVVNYLDDPILEAAISRFVDHHRCHAVLLYGSRARGDHTAASDYDLIGIRRRRGTEQWAEILGGAYIDAFIFGESDLRKVDESHLHMSDARVVLDRRGFGSKLVRDLRAVARRKKKALSESESEARRVWLCKMLARARQGDVEGDYRRAWLQEALLLEYFDLRAIRFLGPKKAFQWLAMNDEPTYRLFVDVLRQPLDLDLLDRLVERVIARDRSAASP